MGSSWPQLQLHDSQKANAAGNTEEKGTEEREKAEGKEE
jgi:hypothetical protein